MRAQIEKLKQKPEPYRRRVQMLVSISLTAIIFLTWVISFGINIDDRFATGSKETASPFSVFRDDFTAAVSQVASGFVSLTGSDEE